MTPHDDLRSRVLAAASASPAPDRRQVQRHKWMLITLGAATMLAVFVAIGGVRPTGRPLWLVLTTALGATSLAFIALVLAFGRGASMIGRKTTTLVWLIVAVPLLLFGWKLGVSASCSLVEWWPDRPGLRCLMWTLTMGGGLLASLIIARRHTVTSRAALLGAALGVAVGATAWALTDLWCPVAHATHLAIGHLAPLLVLAGLGALAGHLVLPIRRGGPHDDRSA